MSSYNKDWLEDLANGKYTIKSKYDNYSIDELVKELEANEKEIQVMQNNVAILNSKLWVQKQINIGLGIAYAVLLLTIGIRLFLSRYKAKIRIQTIEELKNENN